jgi:hexosaminidase
MTHARTDRTAAVNNLTLTSHYTSAPAPRIGALELRLTNGTGTALSDFTMGVTAQGRFSPGADLEGGVIVDQVSTWAEIAPPKGFVLNPGEVWHVATGALDFPLRHWTDGIASAMVKLRDGTVHAIKVARTQKDGVDASRDEIIDISAAAVGMEPGGLSIIPWPQDVRAEGRQSAPEGFALTGHDDVAQAFADLTAHLFPGEALVRAPAEGGFPVTLALASGMEDEAYALAIAAGAATVSASTETGLQYGLITLAQMARGARRDAQRFAFPARATITDAPTYGWRGCHWDVARRFYAAGEVAQFLRILAWNKLNRFHWHLSEDEAWRIEIDAYPELAEKGAWRGYGLPLPPLLGSGPERSGGYYTKAAVRDLVALGARLGIEIVPEIDLPGHCHAMLTALPQLRDPQENGLYRSIQSFPNNCLNPALPQVEAVVQTVLAELCDLFPSRWFHVGADEVPEDAWATSPRAQAMLKAKGGSDMAELQADFLGRLQAFLSARGKITGAWQEAAHGGGIDKANCYLVGWKTVESNRDLAAEGYDVVASPAQAYYLDMANSPDFFEPGAAWAGWSSPEATYAFHPCDGWSDAEKARLKGVQACIWSEPMTERSAFQRLVFPRLSAIAETGWTRAERKCWPRFAGSAHLMPSLFPLSATRGA